MDKLTFQVWVICWMYISKTIKLCEQNKWRLAYESY